MPDQGGAIGGQLERPLGERIGGETSSAIAAGAQFADSLRIMVVAGHGVMPGEGHGQRQANVAQPDHGDLGRAQLLASGTAAEVLRRIAYGS
jgi:hypothetical protein